MAYLDHTFHGKGRRLLRWWGAEHNAPTEDLGDEEYITGSFHLCGSLYDDELGSEAVILCNGESPCSHWLVVMEDYGDNLERVINEASATGQN